MKITTTKTAKNTPENPIVRVTSEIVKAAITTIPPIPTTTTDTIRVVIGTTGTTTSGKATFTSEKTKMTYSLITGIALLGVQGRYHLA